MVNKIAFIVTDGYEDLEFHYPRIRLAEAGYEYDVIGIKKGIIKGKNGYPYPIDKIIQSADPNDYIGLIIPGGALNPDHLRRSEDVLKFTFEIFKQGKLVAAICHAPWVLISAKITKGIKMTSYFSIKDDVINSGADYEDKEVVIDHNLITSRQPDDLPAFMKAILKYLDSIKK